MNAALHAVADALVILGVVVLTLSVLGILRLRSFYRRLHAASAAVLGVVAVLAGTIATQDGKIIARAALVAALLTITAAVGVHAMARARYVSREVGPEGDPDGSGDGDASSDEQKPSTGEGTDSEG